MKLKIRYENEFQTIELDAEATEKMWVSLSLEGEGLSQEERERRIQEAVDETFNRPEYNCWHQYDRHHGNTKSQRYEDDGTGDDGDNGVTWCEPLISEVRDDRIFRRDEIERDRRESYEAVCQRVRQVLVKKTEWADAFIAVRLDGESIRE